MTNARSWVAKGLIVLAAALLLALVGLYALNPFGVNSLNPRERILGHGFYRVPSIAMAPAIEAGQLIFTRSGYYSSHSPERGDVVVVRMPRNGPRVKRIIGLPGETVAIRRGEVEINGEVLPEPYVLASNAANPYSLEMEPLQIPSDSYFLLGDNRDHSEDGRLWGAIDRSELQGKVIMR